MPLLRLTLALGALLLAFAGCADPRTRAEKTLQQVGVGEVRKDAALLYKELFASRGSGFVVVARNAWPKSFQKFGPIRVGAYADGFTLTLATDAVGERGLYVVPQHMERAPRAVAGSRLEPVAEGVYWYSFAE